MKQKGNKKLKIVLPGSEYPSVNPCSYSLKSTL